MKKRILACVLGLMIAVQGPALAVKAELEPDGLTGEEQLLEETQGMDGESSPAPVMDLQENTEASSELLWDDGDVYPGGGENGQSMEPGGEAPVDASDALIPDETLLTAEDDREQENQPGQGNSPEQNNPEQENESEQKDELEEEALSGDSADFVSASADLENVLVEGFEKPLYLFPGKRYDFKVTGDGPLDGEAAEGDTRWVPVSYVFQETELDFSNPEGSLTVTGQIWSQKGVYNENLGEDALKLEIRLIRQEYKEGRWENIHGEDGSDVSDSVTVPVETAALPKTRNYVIPEGKTASVKLSLPISSGLEIRSDNEDVIRAELTRNSGGPEETEYTVRFMAGVPGTAVITVVWKVPEGDVIVQKYKMSVAEALSMGEGETMERTLYVGKNQQISVSSGDESIVSASVEESVEDGDEKEVTIKLEAKKTGKAVVTVKDDVSGDSVSKLHVTVVGLQEVTLAAGDSTTFRFTSASEPSVRLDSTDASVAEGTFEQYTADGQYKVTVKLSGKKPGTARISLYNKDILQKIYKVKVEDRAAVKMTAVYNSAKGADIRWQKAPGAAGYAVYRKRSAEGTKKVASIENGDTLQCYDQEVQSGCWGRVYHYYVRALYKTSDGRTVEGPESEKLILQCLAPVKITEAKNQASRAVKVSFQCTVKENKALGYEVQYADTSSDLYQRTGSFKKIMLKGRNSLSTVIKNLTAGGTCWIRVRCYVDYKNSVTGKQTRTWSRYSNTVSVRISK